jgi:hypothetical protein
MVLGTLAFFQICVFRPGTPQQEDLKQPASCQVALGNLQTPDLHLKLGNSSGLPAPRLHFLSSIISLKKKISGH